MKDKIFVIGGSYSVNINDLKLLKNCDTIAVNKSIINVQNPNYFVTIDYSIFNSKKWNNSRNIVKNIKCDKYFIANFASGNLKWIDGYVTDIKHRIRYDLKWDKFNIVESNKCVGFGKDFNDFRNGENSGHCAIQLAIALGYTDIFILGIDMNIKNKTHFHGGYGQKRDRISRDLNKYYENFRKSVQDYKKLGINLISCSKDSRLNNLLPYINFKEVI